MSTNPAMKTEFAVKTRFFKNLDEFTHWHKVRKEGFSEWYVSEPKGVSALIGRLEANAKARIFDDYLHELQTESGEAVAYLTTVPAYWSGDVHGLHDFHFYEDNTSFRPFRNLLLTSLYTVTAEVLHMPKLFDTVATRLKHRRTAESNCVMLVALTVHPKYRNMKLPSLLLNEVKKTAVRLGKDYVIGPFRPSHYGQFKTERNAPHSESLFKEYVELKNGAGLPYDPWMRAVAREGVEFLRPELRSLRIPGSIGQFEAFRENYRPDKWYSPFPDVWECGETQTWYVDRTRQRVISVEPNIWGVIRLTNGQKAHS